MLADIFSGIGGVFMALVVVLYVIDKVQQVRKRHRK